MYVIEQYVKSNPTPKNVFFFDEVPEKGLLIGRNQSAHILISDRAVSNQHAVLKLIDTKWTITDCGSTNGVYVGNKKIVAETPYVLKEGTHFYLSEPTLSEQSFRFKKVLTVTAAQQLHKSAFITCNGQYNKEVTSSVKENKPFPFKKGSTSRLNSIKTNNVKRRLLNSPIVERSLRKKSRFEIIKENIKLQHELAEKNKVIVQTKEQLAKLQQQLGQFPEPKKEASATLIQRVRKQADDADSRKIS